MWEVNKLGRSTKGFRPASGGTLDRRKLPDDIRTASSLVWPKDGDEAVLA